MRASQVENSASPRNAGSERNASTKTVCTRSSRSGTGPPSGRRCGARRRRGPEKARGTPRRRSAARDRPGPRRHRGLRRSTTVPRSHARFHSGRGGRKGKAEKEGPRASGFGLQRRAASAEPRKVHPLRGRDRGPGVSFSESPFPRSAGERAGLRAGNASPRTEEGPERLVRFPRPEARVPLLKYRNSQPDRRRRLQLRGIQHRLPCTR